MRPDETAAGGAKNWGDTVRVSGNSPTFVEANVLRCRLQNAMPANADSVTYYQDQELLFQAYDRLLSGPAIKKSFPESWQELEGRFSKESLLRQADVIYRNSINAQGMSDALTKAVDKTAEVFATTIKEFVAERETIAQHGFGSRG